MSFSWEFIGLRVPILSILQSSIFGGVQTAPEALSGNITASRKAIIVLKELRQ